MPSTLDDELSILFIAEAFGGGLFEITRMQAEGLAARGHRVAIAYGIRPETPEDVRAHVHPAVELIPTPWSSRRMTSHVRAVAMLRSLVQRWAPDVIHLESSFAGFVGSTALRGLAPTVYSPQGYSFCMSDKRGPARIVFRTLEKITAANVSVIGASSQTEGRQARAIGARRVHVVENGIDELDAPTLRDPSQRERRVIAIGRASPQRQPEAAGRILAQVRDLADVCWIGGGQKDPAGRVALEQAGIPVTGWVPRRRIIDEFDSAAVYLHWTAWDGLPLSVLEAVARDILVVASDIGPNREVLGPRQICPTEAAAVETIRRALTEPDFYLDLLAVQRERRSFFSATRMVDGWEQLYLNLQGRQPQRAEPEPALDRVVA